MNICIIGTGYVGLVAAACLAEMGNDVVCIDVNPEIIDQLKAGKVHIFEPGLEPLVTRNIAEGRLTFSTDLAEGMQDALFVFNCVGTPSHAGRIVRPFLCGQCRHPDRPNHFRLQDRHQ